jgi:Helix-hairpin-helix motif
MRSLRHRSLLIVVSLLLASLSVVVASRPQVAHADSSTSIWPPPAVPSQRPALTLDCQVGEIDLNHASFNELQRLPGVPASVAERIIATRPHDRVEDLLVAPGIGPGKFAQIQTSGMACATPLTLPPPAADVCTYAGQLDVNDPSARGGLARLFGGPTADRLVAGQPYPDLAHARVVLVAGAGPGKVTKYASQLCSTPVPKIHAGTQYAWAYSATGGRADHAGATLVVPKAVLSDPVGSWLSIAPLPVDGVTSGPTFDIEIHGPWSDGRKQVYVALPADPFSPPAGSGDWVPTILHGADNDQVVHALQAVTTTEDGRIATLLTHLSPLESLQQPAGNFAYVAPIVVLPKSTVLDSMVDHKVTEGGDPAECTPDVTSRTDAVSVTTDPSVLATGHWKLLRKVIEYCAEGDLRSDHITVKLTNTVAR